MKQTRVFTTVLLACCAASALCQVVPDAEARKYAELLSKAQYDPAIAGITKSLTESRSSDKALLYLRGRSHFQLHQYGPALRDLEPLGEYRPWSTWQPASQMVAPIKTIVEASPKNVYEIKYEGQVVVRVFYDSESAWNRAILELLPLAYKHATEVFGLRLIETPVYLFDTRQERLEFQRLVVNTRTPGRADEAPADGPGPPGESWIMNNHRFIAINEVSAQNPMSKAVNPNTDPFRDAIATSLCQIVLSRGIGRDGASVLPFWLQHSLPLIASARLFPIYPTQLDAYIRQCLARNHLVTLEEMNASRRFAALTVSPPDSRVGLGEHRPEVDMGTQAVSLTLHIVSNAKKDQVFQFLNSISRKTPIETAFTESLGKSLQAAYDAWREDTVRRLRRPNSP